jgi:hypothetical protein
MIVQPNKDKVNLAVSATLRHTRRAEVWLHSFLTLALDGGELSPHIPAAFLPGKFNLNVHRMCEV